MSASAPAFASRLVGPQLQLGQTRARPRRRAAPRSSRAAGAPRAGSPRSSRRTCAGRRAPGRAGSTASRAPSTAWNSSSSSATPEVVDARQAPVPGLDDDVDRAALELRQPQLEAVAVELLPARRPPRPRRARRRPARSGRRGRSRACRCSAPRRRELRGDEVVVEELHGP